MGMYDNIEVYHHIDAEKELTELLTKAIREEIANEIDKNPVALDRRINGIVEYIELPNWDMNDIIDVLRKFSQLSDLVALLMKRINKRHC